MHEVKLQRVYDRERQNGMRILVDRLWPRGLQKTDADVALWLKEIGPTSELRKWFGHDVARFDEFRTRYIEELEKNPAQQAAFLTLLEEARNQDIILVYGAKDVEHNQAVILREMLLQQLSK